MTQKEKIQKSMEILEKRIKIATQPVAIKMLRQDEEFPEKAKRPSKMGQRWALCQAFFAARTLGMLVGFMKEDQACPIAQELVGFEKPFDFYTEGHLSHGMFTETIEGGKRSEEVLPKFAFGEYEKILVGPLSKFEDIVPDLVLVYGNPGQIVRLIQGALYKTGGNIQSYFTGRAGCIGAIAKCMQSQDYQVVLNGNGERVFGHAQDDEMSFAVPWEKWDALIEGVEGTHQAGVRYPYPAFITYTPQFPKKYQELQGMFEKF